MKTQEEEMLKTQEEEMLKTQEEENNLKTKERAIREEAGGEEEKYQVLANAAETEHKSKVNEPLATLVQTRVMVMSVEPYPNPLSAAMERNAQASSADDYGRETPVH